MIVVLLQGGLGNQMFEYAAAYSFSQKIGCELRLSKTSLNKNEIDDYRLNNLSIACTEDISKDLPFYIRFISRNKILRKIIRKMRISDIKIRNWVYVTQVNTHFLEEFILNQNTNVFLDGYWQNPKYFKEIGNKIVDEFQPSFTLSDACLKWKKEIESCESVSLHIRRGDYLKAKNAPYLIRDEFYKAAIEYVRDRRPNARFFVFSNDKDWCKINYPDYEIVELDNKPNSDIEELYLISLCKNNINANSTFSWWGAYLNSNPNKIVINPERPWNPEIIPNGWIVGYNSGLGISDEIVFAEQ